MSGTPRLRSAYPSTPNSGQRLQNSYGGGKGVSEPRVPLQVLSGPPQDPQAPLLPFSLVDAPSQRLYITFFYLGLTVWRLWDHQRLVSDDSDSLWLFMKWVAIDSVFLYGVPGLKVPWLQWSATTMTILFAVHAIADAVLMFRIPVSTPNPVCHSEAKMDIRYLLKLGWLLLQGCSTIENWQSRNGV